ncbi:MAG: hypothetical protein SFX18_03340 [Pirellulales bacterium]|nr:hypothetical protein [Pirellulales bacterium]
MKFSIEQHEETLAAIFAPLWLRAICFFVAIYLGLTLASLWVNQELVGMETFGWFAVASIYGWVVSFRLFVMNITLLCALVTLVTTESGLAVIYALLAVIGMSCFAGLTWF